MLDSRIHASKNNDSKDFRKLQDIRLRITVTSSIPHHDLSSTLFIHRPSLRRIRMYIRDADWKLSQSSVARESCDNKSNCYPFHYSKSEAMAFSLRFYIVIVTIVLAHCQCNAELRGEPEDFNEYRETSKYQNLTEKMLPDLRAIDIYIHVNIFLKISGETGRFLANAMVSDFDIGPESRFSPSREEFTPVLGSKRFFPPNITRWRTI